MNSWLKIGSAKMLLFGDDLQQNAARNVGAVLLVDDDEFDSLDDQAPAHPPA